EEERKAEVTWEDQQHINQFSKLNGRAERLDEEYKQQKEEAEYLSDLVMEIELLDEDEPVLYKIGEAFIEFTLEKAQARVEKDKERIDQRVADLNSQMSSVEFEMDELKKKLYGKFGKAINLEKS
ncbi:Prefoldin, subunit 4, partial [Coemansia reversa NRRL 1564]